MEIQNYSDKSFILKGETKIYKEQIKEMNGKWNGSIGAWVFSKKQLEKVQAWLDELQLKSNLLSTSTPVLLPSTTKIQPQPLTIPTRSINNTSTTDLIDDIFDHFCQYIKEQKITFGREDLIYFNRFFTKSVTTIKNQADEDVDVYFDVKNNSKELDEDELEEEEGNKSIFYFILNFFQYYNQNIRKIKHSVYQQIDKVKLMEHAYVQCFQK